MSDTFGRELITSLVNQCLEAKLNFLECRSEQLQGLDIYDLEHFSNTDVLIFSDFNHAGLPVQEAILELLKTSNKRIIIFN